MNGRIFEIWVETQLAPTLSKGDIVILDNVAFHKSERAAAMVRAKGAWLLFLPPTVLISIGEIESLFSVTECQNFFKAAGLRKRGSLTAGF